MNPIGNSIIIEDQLDKALTYFPYLKCVESTACEITFPENPSTIFEIFLSTDFPSSAPKILRNKEEFKPSILHYWKNTFTLLQILQHLHLYASAPTNDLGAHLMPPMKRKLHPLKTPQLENDQPSYAHEALQRRGGEMVTTNAEEIISQLPDKRDKIAIIYKNVEDNIKRNRKGGQDISEPVASHKLSDFEYRNAISDLQNKFKSKQISITEYMEEFQNLTNQRERNSNDDI